jgi:hypothetical protein
MLSTLIALSSLSFAQATGGQGESVFPKPEPSASGIYQDRSIFQYLDAQGQPLAVLRSVSDWSSLKYVAAKSSALKLRVLLLVFERDFSDPSISNTLEMNDKQRLIATMSRIRSFFSSMSQGDLDVEVIPRFVPEPIFAASEMDSIQQAEFNRFKFDVDDREERGPFSAIVRVSSSGANNSFVAMGGNESGFALEQGIIHQICDQLVQKLPAKLGYPALSQTSSQLNSTSNPWLRLDPWPKPNSGVPFQLLDEAYRDDLGLVTKFTLGSEDSNRESLTFQFVSGGVTVSKEADALVYTERSIIRSGAAVLPPIPTKEVSAPGGLSFEVRTKSFNPISVGWADSAGRTASDAYSIGIGTQFPIKADGTWQKVTIPRMPGQRIPKISVPQSREGRTRNPHEVIRYEFRGFQLITESPGVPPLDSPNPLNSIAAIEAGLASSIPEQQLVAIRAILQDPAQYKSLQPKLIELSTNLEPAVAFGAIQACGKIGIANDDLIGKAFMNRLVATAPNEYAREAALLYFAEHPEQTTFEAIAPNIVRRSWRTRIATVKALAALDRTDLKAKPAARQLLLTATGQDMAIIRSAALAAMKPEVELERKQLEYSLVNDPSEQVRLQCLKQLAVANAPKEVLFGSLADDSPYVREHVYEQLPANLQRETLQRMVIDRDTYVRAAALYGFAKLPDPTQSGEIQNTFAEEHPAVLLALVEGAQRGKWKLPSNVIENAKKSKSPLVREGVAKLPAQ